MAEERAPFALVVGVPKHDNPAVTVSVARRASDGAFAILEKREEEETATITTQPFSLDTAVRTAASVIAGDGRAITWPHCQRVLAAAFLALASAAGRDDDGEGGAPAAPAPPKGQGFLQLGEGG